MADPCPRCAIPSGSENKRLLRSSHLIHPRCVRCLLESGPDVKTTDAETTPKTDATISITQHGVTSLNRNTALPLTINYRLAESVATLLEKGADVEARNVDCDTPLLLASKNEHGECVNVLTERGDVNRQNIHGATALINATFKGTDRPKTVKRLLKSGADVNVSINTGITALMNAALFGHEKSLTLLIEAGAIVNASSVEG